MRRSGARDAGADRAAANAAHGAHRHQMLLARMTHGAQQRRAEKAAIKSIPDPDARKTAERESKAYEKSPEEHGNRRIDRNGVNLEKPQVEQALEGAGKIVAGTAKRLQRDFRYTLAPPNRTAMKIGGGDTDVHAERPSAAARPAPARTRTIPQSYAQPELAR